MLLITRNIILFALILLLKFKLTKKTRYWQKCLPSAMSKSHDYKNENTYSTNDKSCKYTPITIINMGSKNIYTGIANKSSDNTNKNRDSINK